MEELIKVKSSGYKRYEELLLEKENLKKEAFQYERAYVREFGDLILEVFKKKIACIEKKKKLEYIQLKRNRGEKVDEAALKEYLEKEMAEFHSKLHTMIKDNENARKTEQITEHALLEIKRIYRKLAKRLHPDLNPGVNGSEKLKELWERVVVAYNCNNLKELYELEVIVNLALESEGINGEEIDLPDIDEKIREIEEAIERIRTTDPYMFRFILEDVNLIKEKKDALKEELGSYELYSVQLDELIYGSNGGKKCKMN